MPLSTIFQLYRGGYGLKISGIQIYVKFPIRTECVYRTIQMKT